MEFFDCYGIFVEVNSNVKICRDPKDDFLLSLALDSKAEYLITGDKDLLELEKVGTTKIITLGTTNLAKLSVEQKAVATGKGWTLA